MKSTIVIILILALLLTSCQPTPTQEVVIQKDNFESLVENTPQVLDATTEPIATPDITKSHITWSEETEITKEYLKDWEITLNTKIKVDAIVDLSPKTAPVYTVVPHDFDMGLVKRATEYFFPDGYYDSVRTKDDIISQLLPLEKAVPNILDRTRQPAECKVERLKERYNEAPEKNSQTKLEFDKGYYNIVALKGYPYKDAISEMYVQNGSMKNTLMYYFVDDVRKSYCETCYKYDGTPARGMTTSYEDAKKIASDAVTNIYGCDMALVQTTFARKISLDEYWEPMGGKDFPNEVDVTSDQCYMFYFTRTYNGIPQLYAPEASNHDDMEVESGGYKYERKWDYEYSMKWPAEYAMVYIDDTGIMEFWGFSPTKEQEQINDNVDMLSFDEIFARFKKCIKFTSVWADDITEMLDINITDIKFGMIRVPKKDNPKIYYMVPAWQFIGSKETFTSKVRGGWREKETGKTFLVLNALDGSVIDTSYFENSRASALKTIGIQKRVNHMDVIPPPPN